MRRGVLFISVLMIGLIIASGARARDEIHVVGSSTVYPFVALAAERFGSTTAFKTPIVESTGTGGGFAIFCQGIGENTPDIANASRQIKKEEIELCAKSGITDITELKLGYDGIVIANSKHGVELDLTKQQLFLALAKEVPRNGALMQNDYTSWQQIDSDLPDIPIKVFGPPSTSGTRDSFIDVVMEIACHAFPEFKRSYPDKYVRHEACATMRDDGHYIESGENDNIIVQKLVASPEAIGLFGFSFLAQNSDLVKSNKIGGVNATFEAIAAGDYALARSLYVYVKNAHAQQVRGLREFANELTSSKAVGLEGYLVQRGLIPLPNMQHEIVKKVAKGLKPL